MDHLGQQGIRRNVGALLASRYASKESADADDGITHYISGGAKSIMIYAGKSIAQYKAIHDNCEFRHGSICECVSTRLMLHWQMRI